MALLVSFSPGHDIGYLPSKARQGTGGGERTSGGYYINAAQRGEAPGIWFGRGAEALGLAQGTEVDPAVHEKVFSQVDPRTGAQLGRKPAKYTQRRELLAKLLAAEPHATAARVHELERVAAQQHRETHPYTDFTVEYAKSVSVVHGSIRENARRAAMAGDLAAEAHWADVDARFCRILTEGALVAMRQLETWAVTRTGFGRQVHGEQVGRYEAAGLVTSMWLQGTSRDGDPHDHVHCAIARMCHTDRDGGWRAVDTMALRAQGGAAKLAANAYVQAAMTREFGLGWRPPARHIWGAEVDGVTDAQMQQLSSRANEITRKVKRAAEQWARDHGGRAPNRAETRRIKEAVEKRTRRGKDDAPIDWAALAAQWDATLGGDLAQIAVGLGLGPGGRPVSGNGVPAARSGRAGRAASGDNSMARARPGEGPSPDEQAAAMAAALARVSAQHPQWTRGQLCGELAAVLPVTISGLRPQEAQALAEQLADRAIAGETQPVVCLDAPEWPEPPPQLVRDLDGRSVYTRPGVAKYATGVQLTREQALLARAQQKGAPRLTRYQVAAMLRADPAVLEAQLRESVRAEDSRAVQPSGLTVAQQAAAFHVTTSPRRCEPIEAPAGAGKTRLLAHLARMYRDAHRPVFGLGPSQTAVNVLREEAAGAGVTLTAWNTAKFLGQMPEGMRDRRPKQLPLGAVILVDEGSMVSMDHYAKIMAEAAKRNYKVIVAGDRNQLTAVEHGGGFAFLADELGCVQLPDPVRFVSPWEQDASMRLRLGDTSVLTEYAGQGRVHAAPPDQAKEAARRAYVAEYLAGRDPLLMVESNELAAELNQMIRSDLQHLGYASIGGPEVTLMDGTKAGIGDPLVLRKNYHKADSGEPGRGLANGDTLEITAIVGGTVTVRRLIDSDRETGERRYTPDFAYPYASRSQLAHVVTAHRAQGRTVTVGMALFTGGEEHEWAYPALTRGWESNHAFVFTSSARLADPSPGTRVAPELSRWARIQRERDALDALADPDAEAAGVALEEALGVLSDVLERPGRELSASQWKAHSEASADHLGKAHVRWQSLTADIARTRYEAELRACLPEDLRGVELTGTVTWLWRTLRDAEAAGLDSRQLLQDAIEARSLGDARDVAAVVDDRIRRRTGGLVPLVPRRWAEQVPPVADPVTHEYLTRLAESMDARTERLAAFITANPPAWAVQAVGPVPEDPVARLQWQARVAPVAAYRELFGWDNPGDPIGPEPVNAPEQRAAWHGAFAALGPVNGPDLRSEPDGRLWLMMGTYGSATAWAPRYTGRELRFVRVTARDMGLRAVRHAAEAQAARGRGDLEAAERHAVREARAREVETQARDREASLAASVEAYHEWERITEHERHLAVAARAELVRRHPEQQIPPLRSHEPAPPDEAERAELLWPRIDRQGNLGPEPEGTDGERSRGDERADGDRGRAQDRDRGQDRARDRERGQDQGQERERVRVRVRADGTPEWVRQVQRQTAQVQEKAAERAAERVPNEDPDYEDVGSAWPGLAEAERDAILQPAKPQIEPAPQVAEKVAQRERGYANADPEAEG